MALFQAADIVELAMQVEQSGEAFYRAVAGKVYRPLYVVESRGQPHRKILAYDVNADGRTLLNKRVLIDAGPGGTPDGFRVDIDSLADLDVGATGSLVGEGRVSLVPSGPYAVLNLRGEDLAWAGRSAESLRVTTAADGDAELRIEATGIAAGEIRVDTLTLVTDSLRPGSNRLVIKVDNRHGDDDIPAPVTDWLNYGGLTRDVLLLDIPRSFIRSWEVQLDPSRPGRLRGWIQLDGAGPLPVERYEDDQGSAVLLRFPHVALVSGSAIALTVLGFNLAGDWLRDRLDPRT